MAPRVGVAAYHQANAIVEFIIDGAGSSALKG
jgi:hypothetical protein